MTDSPPTWAFPFDHPHPVAPRTLADELGGKGANLAEMTTVLGLPVPPGFTVVASACRAYRASGWPAGLDEAIDEQLARVEAALGRRLGDPADPLLLSVRSGARSSMPGMLDTVLNLGLTAEAVDGLAAQVGEACAWDSWRRFLLMYADVVLDLDPSVLHPIQDAAQAAAGVADPRALPLDVLRPLGQELLAALEAATGRPLPGPRDQLRAAVEAVFRSWDGARAQAYRRHEGIDDDLGTAVNVQAMVLGNRDERSGTGVAFSRNPATGEAVPYGDFLVQAQGEDVVAGVARTEDLDGLRARFPDLHAELLAVLDRLEAHYQDLCDTEFTIESGRLWMLQTRVGKRTAAAAVRIAAELVAQTTWSIDPAEAVRRIPADALDDLVGGELAGGTVLTTGLPASPGIAVGDICLTADACIDAVDDGRPALLVRAETSPEDIHGMQVAEGILTARGGLVSHAAVVARGWGIPAVVGAEEVELADDHVVIAGVRFEPGDRLAIDGTTGEVRRDATGQAGGAALPGLDRILAWADEIAGAPAADLPPGRRVAAAQAVLAGPG